MIKFAPPSPFTRTSRCDPIDRPAPKAWDAILRDAGYPTDVLVLDFETYFSDDFSMRKMSTIEYIMDERFEVLSLGLYSSPPAQYEDGFASGEIEVEQTLGILRNKYGHDLEHCTVVIQNAKFDAAILAYRYDIYPAFCVDLLGIARHINSRQRHNLALLCKQHDLPDKGRTEDFKGITFRQGRTEPGKRGKPPVQVPLIDAAKLASLREYNLSDCHLEWELFKRMLPELSNPNTELKLLQHTLELYTRPQLRCDMSHGDTLIAGMQAKIDTCIPEGLTLEDITSNNKFDARMKELLGPAEASMYCKYAKDGKGGFKQVVAAAKADASRDILLRHRNPEVRKLMEARVAVKSWPLHISRVQGIMRQAKAAGGLVPVALKYCGAHTGRWSGDEDINLQNMPKWGDDLLVAVRGLLVAPPDHTLVIVDTSQIEARVLAWIAGQWDLVEKFANGQEIYCDFASKVLGFSVRKPRKCGGIPAIEQRMAWARNAVGKIGILGCGYGMGGDKTEGYAKGAIDNATAKKIVETYRREHPQIVTFWKDIERAFIYTAKYRKPCQLPRGLLFYPYHETGVLIQLPNGRDLHYRHVKIVMNEYGHDSIRVYNDVMKDHEHVWGGHLTENVVQAMSRDILAEGMLRLESQGAHIVHHIHDELVIVTTPQVAPFVLQDAEKELSKTPTWAPRLPLGAEGFISERYAKH